MTPRDLFEKAEEVPCIQLQMQCQFSDPLRTCNCKDLWSIIFMKDEIVPATQTNPWIVWHACSAWFEFLAHGTEMCCWACKQIKPVIIFCAPYVQILVCGSSSIFKCSRNYCNLCQCFQAQLELSYCMFLYGSCLLFMC